MRNLRTWALGALAVVGLGAVIAESQTIRNPLRYIPPPSNFYVATTGSDGNKCTAASPCLTIQHVINYLSTQYDFQGQDVTINVGAGTFTGGQISVSGGVPGAAGAAGGSLKIVGTGKATTTYTNSTCGGGNNALQANDGARVKIGSMTANTTCGSGSTLVGFNKATVMLADADFKFGQAAYARVIVYQGSSFNSSFAFEFASGGLFGFAALNNSVILYGPVTVTLTGSPNYSVGFADVITNSTFADGGSTYSGAATGPYFATNANGVIDRESVTLNLPGNLPGILGSGSHIFPTQAACVGGAVGCPIVTAATGLGTGGTQTMITGSATLAGATILNSGSAATAVSGTLYVGLPSNVVNGYCTATPGIGSTPWTVGTVLQSLYSTSGGNAFLQVLWYNGGAALTVDTSYYINYNCTPNG